MNNKDFLLNLDEAGKERIARGLFCYANNPDKLESRWIIKSLLSWAGVDLPCQWDVAIGVVETAALAAGTVTLAAIGVGAAFGGIGVAASYGDTVNDAINCN